MSNSDKEMRFFSILILAVLAIYVLAYTFTFVKVKKEDKAKRIEAEQRMTEYPTLEDLLAHKDEIAKLVMQEGDIYYEMTDKTVITGIMNILSNVELTPVPVNPEDDWDRPVGGAVSALWLSIDMENENEYWKLIVDDYNLPADFVIDHTTLASAATGYRTTESGYYTKEGKIYGKIKSIMYNGTRIDLNEQADTEDEQPVTVDFEYNPEAIYTAEELDYVANEGYFTMDICVSDGKIFFADMKNDIPESHGDYYYESFLKQEYIWGYMDLNGENRHEFKITPADSEYPYAGVSCIIGATDDRVYAMTFRAKDDEYFGKDFDRFIVENYITSFDMSGNVLAETGYKYDYQYPYEHALGDTSFATKEGTLAVFNGALALYDSELNEISLNTDKRISGIYPSPDGNIIALFTDGKERKLAVYSAKNLKVLKEETIPFNYTGEQVKGIIDGKDVLVDIWDEQSGSEKIIAVDLTTGDETEVMDLFHSGINGYDIKSVIEIDKNSILAECDDTYSPRGSLLTRYIKTDENVAKNRKQIVVFGVYDSYLREFNGRSNEYYADKYVGPVENNFSDASELAEIFRGESGPDVALVRNFTDAYFDSGVLADVSELLKENELPDGVKDAFSEGEVLRAYPTYYNVATLVTYKNIAKDGELDQDTFFDCIKQSEGKELFANAWQDVFDWFLMYPGNPFLDCDTGTCNFDGDEFKSFLKMIKTLDDRDHSEDVFFYKPRGSELISWEEVVNQWLTHQKEAGSIFMISTFIGMYYDDWVCDLFGKNMVYTGFPLKEGSKSFISHADAFVVNELSDEKRGALEFIKVYRDVPDRTVVTKADFEASYGALHTNAAEEALAEEIMKAVNDVGGFMYDLSGESGKFIDQTLQDYYNGIISEDETAAAFKEYFEPKE